MIGAPDVLLDPASPDAEEAERIGAQGLRVLLLGSSDRSVDAPDAPGVVTPVALVVLEQRVRPDARDTLDYFASQKVTVKVISGDNAVSVGAVAGSLGLRRRDDGRPQAARRSPTNWPTRWRSTPPSAGCGPTRSAPWCMRCSRAATRWR